MTRNIISFFVLIILSFGSSLDARTSAKDIATEFSKGLLESSSPNQGYKCEGNNSKATCSIDVVNVENKLKLRNVKVGVLIGSKNANMTFMGNVDIALVGEDANLKDFMINRFDCKADFNLNSSTLSNKFNCTFTGNSYTFKSDGNINVTSNDFNAKSVDEALELAILALSSENNSYKILLKDFSLHLNGATLGNKIYTYLKKQNPSVTQEEYNTQVNAAAASIPFLMAQNGNVTAQMIDSLSKISTNLALVLTSKKQGISAVFRHKTNKAVGIKEFLALIDSNRIFNLLNDYNVSVTTR